MLDLRADDLDYPLPEDRIATRPAEPRDSARMLVVRRRADAVEHLHVRDLPVCLRAGDVAVFNDTAVVPARIVGRRRDTGGRVEGLYLEDEREGAWRVMLRSNGRLRAGLLIDLDAADGSPSGVAATLLDRDGATWRVRPEPPGATLELLAAAGRTPLPPYILAARGGAGVEDALDRAWYQTVYADPAQRRSVAAPTAGLHFTPDLLARLDAAGVIRRHVTLHVGAGTFKPVTAPTLADHVMHAETCRVARGTIDAIRGRTGRLVAVGTTSVRCLESLPGDLASPSATSPFSTDLLIAPGYAFRHVDALLTNFHLPRSTLLALVAAMVGLERLLAIYAIAVREGYRFYSYGDAMLVLD